ncbi:hypothetical protein ASZ90_017203 [hydrocarbon metagenome]|uniref:Uncharacterized protein n=1 Tax=hydrocarbon metagenome TaxID=938273 RepID=A0A0W8E9P3_9ZZZZ
MVIFFFPVTVGDTDTPFGEPALGGPDLSSFGCRFPGITSI